MKKSLIFVGMLAIGYANAQEGNVGINTENPKATLDIQPSAENLGKTTNEGLLIPRLSKARVVAIASGNLVEGTKVYVTDEVTAADTQFIGTGKGFYFYNGTKWVKQLASDTNANTELWAQRNNGGITETYLKPADEDGNKYQYSEKGALLNLGGVTREDTRWVMNGNYGWGEGEVPNMIMISSDKLPQNSTIGNNAVGGTGVEFYFNKNFSLLKEAHARSGNKAGSKNYVGNVTRLSSLDVTSKIGSFVGSAIGADAYSAATINNLKGVAAMTVAGSDTQGATVTHNIAGEFTARNFPTSTSTNLIGIDALNHNYGKATNIIGGRFRAYSSNNYDALGITNPVQTIQDLQGIRALVENRANSTTALLRGAYITSDFLNSSVATEGYGIDVRSYVKEGSQVDMLSNVNSYIRSDYGANTVKDVYGFRFHHILNNDFKPTNMYGLYLADVNKGTALNYAIYANEGKVRLGDLKGTGNRIVTVDADGVLSTSDATTIAAQNIYNTDGTLTANRVVNLENKRLTFNGEGTGKVRVGSSIENENSSAKFGVITPLDNGAVKNTFFLAPNLSEGNSTHITVGKTFGRNNNGSIDFVYRGNNSNKNGIALNTDSRTNGYILFAQADGNVGINTDNPVRKLDVVGGARFAGENGGTSIWIDATSDTGNAIHRYRRNESLRWDIGMNGDADTDTNGGANYYITSFQNDGATAARRLTISRENGNVGIGGMLNPSEKLEVDGNIKTSSLARSGAGDRPVYADENGVLKTGSSANVEAGKVASTNGLQCNAENRGKMNFIPNDNGSDVFGICLRNKDGNYYWGYMVGGNNPTNGTGAFGSGL